MIKIIPLTCRPTPLSIHDFTVRKSTSHKHTLVGHLLPKNNRELKSVTYIPPNLESLTRVRKAPTASRWVKPAI